MHKEAPPSPSDNCTLTDMKLEANIVQETDCLVSGSLPSCAGGRAVHLSSSLEGSIFHLGAQHSKFFGENHV
eukprot:864560-Amphidinium_carterae.1